MIFGYARISAKTQSSDTQVHQLTEAGCNKIFREVAGGAKADRAQRRRLLAGLDAGDVVIVTRLDRLAHSTRDLLNTLAAIASRKAGFRSLSEAWADTTSEHGRLVLATFLGMAEFDRRLIASRAAEGVERARARGVKMGRRPKLTPHQQNEARQRREAGELLSDIAQSYNVHKATISRLLT
jgi:DNA invertase Pin-like site-specific DNA recombinase